MNMPDEQPLVQFYRLIDGVVAPRQADRSAAGTLPTRAFRYCQAAANAAAFGWWLFPPTDLTVLWDGHDIFWAFPETDQWLPLQPSAQAPDFGSTFDAAAPEQLRGYSPPMLTALPEPGTLQIWTGLIARSRPDWHLLLRAPANLPLPGGFTLYEGIVETDTWFGPLFTNLRLTRTNTPIRLRPDYPFLQAQPVRRGVYSPDTLSSMSIISDMAGMSPVDWDDYNRTVVIPNLSQNRPHGSYAVRSRKRQAMAARCPITHQVSDASWPMPT
jgi:hypothetical protein